jgi:hypothetical protein
MYEPLRLCVNQRQPLTMPQHQTFATYGVLLRFVNLWTKT